jgi:hypothetical protein
LFFRRNSSFTSTTGNHVLNDEDVQESYHQSTKLNIHYKETVFYDRKVLTSAITDREDLRHRHHQRSNSSKSEIKNKWMIDAYQPPPIDPPPRTPEIQT